MSEMSRLRWQCRRGMRELDDLLLRYLDTCYESADPEQKAAFQTVLTLSDPVLNGYLLQRQVPENASISVVVQHILDPPAT